MEAESTATVATRVGTRLVIISFSNKASRMVCSAEREDVMEQGKAFCG
jgi:hypothetical protein